MEMPDFCPGASIFSRSSADCCMSRHSPGDVIKLIPSNAELGWVKTCLQRCTAHMAWVEVLSTHETSMMSLVGTKSGTASRACGGVPSLLEDLSEALKSRQHYNILHIIGWADLQETLQKLKGLLCHYFGSHFHFQGLAWDCAVLLSLIQTLWSFGAAFWRQGCFVRALPSCSLKYLHHCFTICYRLRLSKSDRDMAAAPVELGSNCAEFQAAGLS